MEEEMSVKEAVNKVKEFIADMRGAETKISGRKLIDWLEFSVMDTEDVGTDYIITCQLKENMFSDKKVKYKFVVSKHKREVKEVEEIE